MKRTLAKIKRWALGLRLRLTVSYVILFTLVTLGLGLLFGETLSFILHNNASVILNEEWAAVKGYLRIISHRPEWFYDREDEEETFIVQRLRKVLLLTDKQGLVLEVSPEYSELGVESPKEIQEMLRQGHPVERVRRSPTGEPYLVRSGLLVDDGRKEFMLSIGRPLADDERVVGQFMRRYYSIVPLLILAISIIGWIMAGRALRPVNDVAHAAASITGENLSLRIPERGADDELEHLIRMFNGMVDRLETSFNQVRQFSIDVSHELRTPLTAVRGQLEVALFTAKTNEQYREAMISAMEDVDRLGKIVRTLLHLSQAETGQVTLARELIDLSKVTGDVVEQFQIAAEVENLELKASLDINSTIRGDRVQLERMISNLLSNAVKYTPRGGMIEVFVRQTEEHVVLEVSDTGRGIPAEHLPRIFERFYRVPDGDPDPDKGLGLGLSFVAWIVKVHGGKITVDSTPGEGTRFQITFLREVFDQPQAIAPTGDRIVA
jgi:heavy metal sensor kinase